MDVNAKVDIGQNLTSLLEKLAQQIGTTTDKVFPWYVQQAYLEGATTLIALSVAFVIFSCLLLYNVHKADWEDGNANTIFSIIFGIATLITCIGWASEGAESVRKMINPNYYAMQSFTRDIGRLAGR